MIQIIKISSFNNEPFKLDKWYDSLLWCPSQCYQWKIKDGINYILYLRWRWNDPWQGHIIKNANSENLHLAGVEWSTDILSEYNFSQDQLELAKVKIIELFLAHTSES